MTRDKRSALQGIRILQAACALMLLFFAGGCTYSFTWVNGVRISNCMPNDIHEATWEAYNRGDYERAAHLGAYIPENHPDDPNAEEALFLAADSCYRLQEFWQSFQHFKELLARYPVSQYVGDIAERDFLIGENFLNQEPGFFGHLFTNRDRGVKVMNHLLTHFSHHNLADDAQMAIADYFFDDDELEEAAFNYKQLLKLYGGSEWAEKATYRLGLSYLYGSKGYSYDRDTLVKACVVLERYVIYYDKGNYIESAREHSQMAQDQLARKEQEIAYYYMKQDCDFGARVHFANLVLLFPKTEAGQDAARIMEARDWDCSLHATDRITPQESMRFLPGDSQMSGSY